MASDSIYEQCLPILQNPDLEEEDKTDQLEELVRKEGHLNGKPLENAVLDILWKFRNGGAAAHSSPIVRHAVVRKGSPAPWQASRSTTPVVDASPRSSAASPAPPPGLSNRPSLFRMRSSQRSPFTSPRPSPLLAFATPLSQASSSADATPGPDTFGDYAGSDSGDWHDDASNASSYFGEYQGSTGAESSSQFMMNDMTPYDILRSVLRDQRTDEEIEAILQNTGYDLSAAIASLTESGQSNTNATLAPNGLLDENSPQDKTFLVGKSMNASSRPVTPAGQQKTPVVCRYWLQTGQCLRADCRFSHDLAGHICKYWLAGNCLAGDSCIFSHDPSALMSNMSLDGQYAVTPPVEPNFQDYGSFPSLSGSGSPGTSLSSLFAKSGDDFTVSTGFSPRAGLPPEFIPSSKMGSRPTSRQQSGLSRSSNAGGIVDDNEAFPALGAAIVKPAKKHHGKRGHGHSSRAAEKENSSLADIVKAAPTASATLAAGQKKSAKPVTATPLKPGDAASTSSNSPAALAIPPPEKIPWLATGDEANRAYLKARQEAIRHGGARNKFLQSAAQAWNRQDVRAAKALSLRGQAENDAMREAHREAARQLYEERNKQSTTTSEVYVDMHGLHPTEATEYLGEALAAHRKTSAIQRDASRFLYAIVGTGHHSKGGRDKVGKAVRGWLVERGFAFREFSVPSDRGGSGGILGIDVASGKLVPGGPAKSEPSDVGAPAHGKIRILKSEDVRPAGQAVAATGAE